MSKNARLLGDFVRYCAEHPEQRFWQALRNWSGYSFIYGSDIAPFDSPDGYTDTFFRNDQGPADAAKD